MKPGAKLYTLLIEHVFDGKWVTEDEEQPEAVPYLVYTVPGKDYTDTHYPGVAKEFPCVYENKEWFTTWEGAREVVDAMHAKGFRIKMWRDGEEWYVSFRKLHGRTGQATANTFPLAAAFAALDALNLHKVS